MVSRVCGIAGLWVRGGARLDVLEAATQRMAGVLEHRGPDGRGRWSDPFVGVGLGHTRLSIIDLSETGDQPMVDHSGSTLIVFNGEIYNYLELRATLESDGVKFRGTSDTEVLLALYAKFGLECLAQLRGMFAFAIWDGAERRLVLARDRVGKKPLYYWAPDARTLCFASEIKAVRAASPTDPGIDSAALNDYLRFGFVGGPRTIYRGIRQVPPGHALVSTAPPETRVVRYWQPEWSPKKQVSFDEAVERTGGLLRESVNLRLRADVPVGVLLSGGIDSGLITSFAARKTAATCKTFSIGFENEEFDERPLARAVARRYATDHHEVLLRPDVSALIPKVAWHYDQPFADASAVPTFAVAEYARRHVKVVLTGDGGDESFAGYRRDLSAALLSSFTRLAGARALTGASRLLGRLLPVPRSHRDPYALGYRFIRGLSVDEAARMVVWSSDGFSDEERLQLGQAPESEPDESGAFEALIGSLGRLGLLDRALALDLLWILPYDLLAKVDIATMAHGLEARSPFLDQELVGWALELPETIRLGGIETKPILRSLARKYLPSLVSRGPKRGFEVPLYRWVSHDLRELRDDLVLSRSGLLASIFDRRKLERLLRDPVRGSRVRWAQLRWILIMLAAWDLYADGAAARASS
jgi:asparagine synthase (glutamine-hydrolysing)